MKRSSTDLEKQVSELKAANRGVAAEAAAIKDKYSRQLAEAQEKYDTLQVRGAARSRAVPLCSG
jgi:hypothetical protein